jgi:hypothetical protein
VKKDEEFKFFISDSDEAHPTPFIFDFASGREKELIKKEFNDYMKKLQEISGWLDDISQNNLKKNYNVISDDSFDIEVTETDVTLERISDFIASKTEIINKKLELQINYEANISADKCILKNEIKIFEITDVEVDYFDGFLICLLYTKDPFGEPSFILIEESSLTDYVDLEKEHPEFEQLENIIIMYPDLPVMSRKQKRDYERNRKFPYADLCFLVPSNYQSIETFKTITSILAIMNQRIREDEHNDNDED